MKLLHDAYSGYYFVTVYHDVYTMTPLHDVTTRGSIRTYISLFEKTGRELIPAINEYKKIAKPCTLF